MSRTPKRAAATAQPQRLSAVRAMEPAVLEVRRAASLAGTVLDATTSAPIARARVVLSSAAGKQTEVTSGRDGTYVFANLADDAYQIQAAAPNDRYCAATSNKLTITRARDARGRLQIVLSDLRLPWLSVPSSAPKPTKEP